MERLMKVLKIALTIVLLPIFLYLCNISDRNTLDRNKIINDDSSKSKRVVQISAGLHSCSPNNPYQVFAIFMEPNEPSPYPPICIPNGLGATAVLIAPMQEALVKHGFRVLSYDRLGVGLSDENKAKRFPSAMDVVKEMDFVMESVLPGEKWLLLGPSMGSIVAQCYIAHHSEKVLGMLNMDGLPYPFLKMRTSFVWAAFIYRVYASIMWTGVLRPFIGASLKSSAWMFASNSFPLSVAIAQINQTNFFGNVALEMLTMMDCCEMADAAWGSLSVLRLPVEHLESLVRAPPNVSIEFVPAPKGSPSSSSSSSIAGGKNELRQVTLFRSPSEKGSDWATDYEVQQTVAFMRSQLSKELSSAIITTSVTGGSNTDDSTDSAVVSRSAVELQQPLLQSDTEATIVHKSLLGNIWPRLVVRVMSGRNHDFGNAVANSFYSQEMRDLAAAEHAQQVLLASDGYRTAYPRVTHNIMFSKTDDIVRNMHEIAEVVNQLRQK